MLAHAGRRQATTSASRASTARSSSAMSSTTVVALERPEPVRVLKVDPARPQAHHAAGRQGVVHRLGIAGVDDRRHAALAGLGEHVADQRVGNAGHALGHGVRGRRRNHQRVVPAVVEPADRGRTGRGVLDQADRCSGTARAPWCRGRSPRPPPWTGTRPSPPGGASVRGIPGNRGPSRSAPKPAAVPVAPRLRRPSCPGPPGAERRDRRGRCQAEARSRAAPAPDPVYRATGYCRRAFVPRARLTPTVERCGGK